MDWARDLPGWPLSHLSRRVASRPHRWHVQETGTGPTLLLLHGAGASSHSFRALIPALAEDHHVVALDLPGHGFTALGTRARSGLGPMAEDIAALCRAEGWTPHAVIGHSAGAAAALQMARVAGPPLPRIVGLNAALDRFDGVAGWLFPMLAKLLALNPLTALAFAAGGNRMARARRLIESTGSHLDEEGLALYARLIGDRAHVDGTLQMMAQWDVAGLDAALPQIAAPCLLITGERDRAVPPSVSGRAATRLPRARHLSLPELGHLAHEESPAQVVDLIRAFSAEG
ncbi:MAG: magnesium chelatase [Roseovarius sp.]|mgnify:CR=1 FL=1|nr:magnesium chelatase [Roseovarius sp.]MBK45791.1 magnesium chelatase [Roseovarius sp.]|tara:strand:+ start:134 stop:994 length:861 start_codon:yes stop_codon:yes gene_type:complete